VGTRERSSVFSLDWALIIWTTKSKTLFTLAQRHENARIATRLYVVNNLVSQVYDFLLQMRIKENKIDKFNKIAGSLIINFFPK
jgi:hypothetical protein